MKAGAAWRVDWPLEFYDKVHVAFLVDAGRVELQPTTSVVRASSPRHVLNDEEHAGWLEKRQRPVAEYQPYKLQALLKMALGSPLNMHRRMAIRLLTAHGDMLTFSPFLGVPDGPLAFKTMLASLIRDGYLRDKTYGTVLATYDVGQGREVGSEGALRIRLDVRGTPVVLIDAFSALPQHLDLQILIGNVQVPGHGADAEQGEQVDYVWSISQAPLDRATVLARVLAAIENLWEAH